MTSNVLHNTKTQPTITQEMQYAELKNWTYLVKRHNKKEVLKCPLLLKSLMLCSILFHIRYNEWNYSIMFFSWLTVYGSVLIYRPILLKVVNAGIPCGSRFIGAGIRTSRHGYSEAVDRSCLRQLTWWNIWGPGIERNALVSLSSQCLIFTAATLACHCTSSRRVCTLPLLSRAWTRASGLVAAVSSYASKVRTKTERNSIID